MSSLGCAVVARKCKLAVTYSDDVVIHFSAIAANGYWAGLRKAGGLQEKKNGRRRTFALSRPAKSLGQAAAASCRLLPLVYGQ